MERVQSIERNRNSINLVILDIIMSSKGLFSRDETENYKLTGLKLFSKISALLPDVPIIVLTILDDKKIKDRMLNMGAKSYLLKEKTSPSVLCEKVNTYFRKTS